MSSTLRIALRRYNRMVSIGAILFFCICSVSSGVAVDVPYRSMMEETLHVTGPDSLSASIEEVTDIRIGFFAPNEGDGSVARSMIRGASLAIEEANRLGGYQGKPFVLVRRWSDNPWANGAKRVVQMAYEDRVWAVVGAQGGDTAHLAQLVTTKVRLAIVSPLSSDPSLTQTRVPWIFRLPPDETSQAIKLSRFIKNELNLQRIGLITSTDYDGRVSGRELSQAMNQHRLPPVFHFTVEPSAESVESIVERLDSFKPEALILRLPQTLMEEAVVLLAEHGVDLPILTPWIPGVAMRMVASAYPGEIYSIVPFRQPKACGVQLKFKHHYGRRFGEGTDAVSAYTYDAVWMVIEAIKQNGLSRNGIRNAIAKKEPWLGAAGIYDWDTGGGNQAQAWIMDWKSQSLK